jgi:hypothetical protein
MWNKVKNDAEYIVSTSHIVFVTRTDPRLFLKQRKASNTYSRRSYKTNWYTIRWKLLQIILKLSSTETLTVYFLKELKVYSLLCMIKNYFQEWSHKSSAYNYYILGCTTQFFNGPQCQITQSLHLIKYIFISSYYDALSTITSIM